MTAGAHIAQATGQRGRRRRASPLPASTPHRCVSLNVDTGRNSGWCIGTPTGPRESGEVGCYDFDAVTNIIRRAIAVARELDMTERDVVLVLEIPFAAAPKGEKHKQRNQYTVARGVGKAAGCWLMAWCHIMGTVEPHRFVEVMHQDWRMRVLGVAKGIDLPDREQRMARFMFKAPTWKVYGSDEAAAICMSHWSLRSGEVAAVLPKRVTA